MLYNYIMLALCVSIDSFGTGVTYGLKNTKISRLAKLTLFIFSFFIAWKMIHIPIEHKIKQPSKLHKKSEKMPDIRFP